MDALVGRNQTTRGIWLARSPKVAAPTTLVMDLEGSDGRERGEDDTSFERQSALFALATADILLINMWAKDVGREAGAGKPLLKTIFQVNLKLFQPSPGARRTVLLFVFRDRTKTPLDKLKETWAADLQRMWDGITKPPAYESSSIDDFFDLQFSALSNYEDRQDEFLAETTLLRRRFTHDADEDEGLLRAPLASKLPGQALSLSMCKVWEIIHDNKDLNLPAHRVMVANIRCAEIAAEQLATFASNEGWVGLRDEAEGGVVPQFGITASALLRTALEGYESEARYFDPGVSASRAEQFREELHALVRPAFDAQLALACGVAMDSFRLAMSSDVLSGTSSTKLTFVAKASEAAAAALTDFDAKASEILIPGTDWSTAPARESLQKQLTAHQASLRAEKVASSLADATSAVDQGVAAGAMPLLEAPPLDLWPRLSAVVDREAKSASTAVAKALHGYGVEAAEEGELRGQVRTAARARLLSVAKEAANTALPRLKDCFAESFQKDEVGMPRTWTPAVDIPAVATDARRAAARLLSQLSIVRLGGGGGEDGPEHEVIDKAMLNLAEMVTTKATGGGGGGGGMVMAAATTTTTGAVVKRGDAFDLTSANEWPGISKEDVLLSPAQVRTIWRQFSSDVALSVQQAAATQEANRLAQNRLPPLWAIAAMMVLGFNEFVAVLRNPLLLAFLVLVFLFARTVYNELDVEGEMARGLLPGAMALSAKFVPTVKSVALRTFESARAMMAEGGGGGGGGGGGSQGGTLSPEARLGNGSAAAAAAAGRVRFDAGDGLRARRREVEMGAVGGGDDGDVLGGDLLDRRSKDD